MPEIDAAPAKTIAWLLAIENARIQAENDAQEEAGRKVK